MRRRALGLQSEQCGGVNRVKPCVGMCSTTPCQPLGFVAVVKPSVTKLRADFHALHLPSKPLAAAPGTDTAPGDVQYIGCISPVGIRASFQVLPGCATVRRHAGRPGRLRSELVRTDQVTMDFHAGAVRPWRLKGSGLDMTKAVGVSLIFFGSLQSPLRSP